MIDSHSEDKNVITKCFGKFPERVWKHSKILYDHFKIFFISEKFRFWEESRPPGNMIGGVYKHLFTKREGLLSLSYL